MSGTAELESDLLALSGGLSVIFNSFVGGSGGIDFTLGDNPRRLAFFVLYPSNAKTFTVAPAGAEDGSGWEFVNATGPVRFNVGDFPGLLNQSWNFTMVAAESFTVVEVRT